MDERVCLQVHGRVFMARCRMSLSNPIWRKVLDHCLSFDLELLQPAVNAVGIDAHI